MLLRDMSMDESSDISIVEKKILVKFYTDEA